MASVRAGGQLNNLKKVEGYPGLYTYVNITRNPRKEKALLARIARDARKLREQTYIVRLSAKPAR